jgi:CheY-like chemotaxis protein
MISLDLMAKFNPGEEGFSKALEIAKRQGKQLTNLVDDLLDLTRITQNKVTLKKETVEINELINKAVQDYQPLFIDKNVKLEVQLTTPLFMEADSSRLTQVIGNLLHNAAKFTRNNDSVTVTVAHEKNCNEVLFTVQDNGQGIDPHNIEHLFEPFTQVDKTLDRSNGGLGLGLAIVKGMVELHGGSVEAFSEGEGKGAKFTIKLPLPKKDVSIEEFDAGTNAVRNKSLKILIIDDNKDLAEIICELISSLGYITASAHNGREGITKARALQPDVIICDIGLPDMSGFEVAKLIRKDFVKEDTFIIALSGYAQPEDIERSKEAGFDRHLGKPVSLEKLQMVLNEVK